MREPNAIGIGVLDGFGHSEATLAARSENSRSSFARGSGCQRAGSVR